MPPPAVPELQAAVAAGDPEGLHDAYRMWGALIYTIALRATGEASVAAELTAETFLAVWHRGYSTQDGPLSTRLERTCRALARRRAVATGADVNEIADLDAAIDRVVLRDALTGMSEPTRSVLRLSLQDGYSAAEVSKRLDLTPEVVPDYMLAGLAGLGERVELSRVR